MLNSPFAMSGYYDIQNLSKNFSDEKVSGKAALSIDQLCIPLGGIIAIVGSSGAGKTTLLNLLGGLEPADRSVVAGQPVHLNLKIPSENRVRQLASQFSFTQTLHGFPYSYSSYVFQQGYLINQASLGINLGITRRAAGWRADTAALVRYLELARLNSEQFDADQQKELTTRAVELSGGQQQRINIARALGREPSFLFADELTSNLDPRTAESVMESLRIWVRGENEMPVQRTTLDKTIFWVTHDYALAIRYADAILVLSDGKLISGINSPIELANLTRSVDESDLLSWVNSGQLSDDVIDSIRASNISPESVVSANENRLFSPSTASTKFSGARINKLQAAIGNMKDGILLSLMEAFKPSGPNGVQLAQKIPGFIKSVVGFTNWMRAVQLAGIIGLVMIISHGQNEVIAYFDEQLDDPSLRHVIVRQNMREPQRSRLDANTLRDLNAVLSGFDGKSEFNAATELKTGSTHKDKKNAAFIRISEQVDVFPVGHRDSPDANYSTLVTIGALQVDEPVFESLEVYKITRNSTGCSISPDAKAGDLLQYANGIEVLLTKEFMDEFDRVFEVNVCNEPLLEFRESSGDPITVKVVGFVDTAPADGYDNFQILMSKEGWNVWRGVRNKPYKDSEISFGRAAVYFNQFNNTEIIQEISDRSFSFDKEIVSKFQRVIATASNLRSTFLVITWLTLIVAATVTAGLVWNYLSQNAKSIAVLRAHGAWLWTFLAAIPFQIALTFAYACFYLCVSVIAWNLLVAADWFNRWVLTAFNGQWTPRNVDFNTIMQTVPWVIGCLIIMILVGWLCLLLWRVTHRNLAHELRQAF